MWMPIFPITMVGAKPATDKNPCYATFRVPPKMTKWEVREYLTKIYQLPVRKVNTMNYLGKRKRLQTERGMVYFKYKDFKKAVVYFEDSFIDVGIGMSIPELEDSHDDQYEPAMDSDDVVQAESYSTDANTPKLGSK
jgi:large subunit ribosomal protein L23